MSELSWNDIRSIVYQRANGCCEYCQTCEVNTGQTMQIDHIDPDGGDDLNNLCLACWNCNNHKRTATKAIDPETQENATLFNPRRESWNDHFEWKNNSTIIDGLTSTSRATIDRLKMNRPAIVIARKRWVQAGFHPPT